MCLSLCSSITSARTPCCCQESDAASGEMFCDDMEEEPLKYGFSRVSISSNFRNFRRCLRKIHPATMIVITSKMKAVAIPPIRAGFADDFDVGGEVLTAPIYEIRGKGLDTAVLYR